MAMRNFFIIKHKLDFDFPFDDYVRVARLGCAGRRPLCFGRFAWRGPGRRAVSVSTLRMNPQVQTVL